VDDGVAHGEGQAPVDEPPPRGFFSRAWHAVF
jgi:hypothetical protein